jgi:hypothetical protein
MMHQTTNDCRYINLQAAVVIPEPELVQHTKCVALHACIATSMHVSTYTGYRYSKFGIDDVASIPLQDLP